MKTFRSLWAVAGLGVALSFAGPARGHDAEMAEAPAPRFSDVVAKSFGQWDVNRDGRLSPTEIDKLVVNPSVQGSEAAAAAALKRIVRSEKYELPALTKDFLTKGSSNRDSRRAPVDTDREDSTERTAASAEPKTLKAATPAPDFQSRYVQCLSRIEKTDRTLFASASGVKLDHCHQGPLGDCFLVAPIGGIAKSDPAAIRSMITTLSGDAGYSVRFGNGKTVRITPLTDAEIAISSTTSDRGGNDGIWLAVLEKAYGTMRVQDNPSRYEMQSATDAIAKGGSTGSVIQTLTGNRTDRITLRRPVRGWNPDDTSDAGGRTSRSRPSEPAGDVEALAKKVRDGVKKALDAGRLVAAGTGDDRMPPGISARHAYAVTKYDEGRDVLTLWNPHGNSHRVRGTPGLTGGYTTKSGVFEIPVKDFVRVFNGVTLETDRSAGRR